MTAPLGSAGHRIGPIRESGQPENGCRRSEKGAGQSFWPANGSVVGWSVPPSGSTVTATADADEMVLFSQTGRVSAPENVRSGLDRFPRGSVHGPQSEGVSRVRFRRYRK